MVDRETEGGIIAGARRSGSVRSCLVEAAQQQSNARRHGRVAMKEITALGKTLGRDHLLAVALWKTGDERNFVKRPSTWRCAPSASATERRSLPFTSLSLLPHHGC
ncbi:MAG: hypothetical protein ABIS06_13210 [Vicinamibacterales bacterium]